MKDLYLVDGSGYIFRAYFALNKDRSARLSAPDGTPTGAVYVFNQMLLKLMKDIRVSKDTLVGITFDVSDRDTFRHEIYPDYKAHRPEPPEDLIPQFGMIRELVRAWDLPLLELRGYEADDLLATLTRLGVERGYRVTVVSGDKDLLQLVRDNVTVWDPMRDAHFDREGVKAKMGVYPEQVADYLALLGDAVDNVPGVPKVGAKTAVDLLTQYGSVAGVYAHLDEIKKPALKQTLTDHRADADMSRRLVVLNDHSPVELDESALHYTEPNREKVEPLFARLGFSANTLAQTLGISSVAAAASSADAARADKAAKDKELDSLPPAEGTPVITAVANTRGRYELITTLEGLHKVAAEAKASGTLSLVSESVDLGSHPKEWVGVALSPQPGVGYYVPLAHRYLAVPAQLPRQAVVDVLQTLTPTVTYDKKKQLHLGALRREQQLDDVLLLSYVLDPERTSHDLAFLSSQMLNHNLQSRMGLIGKKAAADWTGIPVELMMPMAAERADVVLQLQGPLRNGLHDHRVYDMEMKLVSVLYDMEHAGIAVSRERLALLREELWQRMQTVEKDIFALAGGEINIGSPKQLAQLLFEKLQLPVLKRTKTGPSTDHTVLEQLAEQHPLPKMILDHRMLQKLLSTYVEALPQLLDSNGRVHTSFNQAVAATGRLSSQDPNLQNIPIRTELGRRIRGAFLAAPGCQLVAADYSQIELRVLAHLSGDEALIDAFVHGADIHQRTAMKLFSVAEDAVTKDQRRRAKTLNFGLLYGLSAFRLAREEDISMGEAKQFIEAYFGAYPKIRKFIDETVATAKSRGYVETIMGRRRYIPDLRSKSAMLRQAAERVATNTPVQGSAADLMKLAMLKVAAALKREQPKSRMVLQVHDELVIECPRETAEATAALLRTEMEGAYALSVPLTVDVTIAEDWDLGA